MNVGRSWPRIFDLFLNGAIVHAINKRFKSRGHKMFSKSVILGAILCFILQPAALWAQDVATGSIMLKSTSEEILGKELADQYKTVVDIDEELTWLVYVPENYDPENPPGVLLYQNYSAETSEPTGWKAALDEKNMMLIRIFVRGQLTQRKEMLLSILGPTMLQQHYALDASRIYTSAFNGCRNAGTTAKIYPNIIKGAIYINCIPSTWRDELPERLDLMRQNRYIFITARDRVEQVDVRQELKKYREAGIENTKFVRTGRLSRTRNLRRPMLVEALDYLDGIEE